MTKNKILIIFAHPLFEKSHAHKALVDQIPDSEEITFHDLYELYPDFNIDIRKEQEILKQHSIIILQHPMYWYSCPPILKQWIDLVLEYNWAYGVKGTYLEGKFLFQVITTGGKKENYSSLGKDRFTIFELLEPFNQTAQVCKMIYLPPYVVHGTHEMKAVDYLREAKEYNTLLQFLINNELSFKGILEEKYLNDWFQRQKQT